MDKFYLVAVNTPFNHSMLTYKSSDGIIYNKGQLVKVPLGTRKVDGCIWKEVESPDNIESKKIKSISETEQDIMLSPSECDLFEWMSNYYHYPLGQLINDVLPNFLKRPRKLNFIDGLNNSFEIKLNPDQQAVCDGVINFGMNKFSKWLVHGVTGAGKTFIYLTLIKETIKNNKSVLFLLPEINLTPQFLKTFESFLNIKIYSYNSSVSNSDKYGLWKLLQENTEPVLILGVRSSVFLPIKNLGLIIVDEEHDQSFKQDDRCTYNARDVAIKKAQLESLPIVLGSATPMIETYSNFKKTDHYFAIRKRAQESKLPKISLVDMRGLSKIEEERMIWPYTKETIFKIKKALEKKEQVLVFINRLGYSSYLQCGACGHQFSCPNCSTSLKYFKKRNQLQCQTCEYTDKKPEMCPECMNLNLVPKGFGTERAHEILQELLPEKSVERFDRDEIRTFNQLEDVLSKFHNKEINVLVGTQMLSKGHNFEDVNLVVVLGIDSQLNFPDFRSNERVYQTLTQVGGRAGRFGKDAEVLILSLAPENKIFSYIKEHSFDGFYNDEIILRKICNSPPYAKVVMIYFSSKSQEEVINTSENAVAFFRQIIKKHFNTVEVLGPRPSIVEKKVNKFTWSLLIRTADLNELHNSLKTFLNNFQTNASISLKVDVDPYYFD